MPVYRYEPREKTHCTHCRSGFETTQPIKADALTQCPECGAPIRRVPVTVSVATRQASFDDRAKAAGFSKLKKLGKGEYEKQY